MYIKKLKEYIRECKNLQEFYYPLICIPPAGGGLPGGNSYERGIPPPTPHSPHLTHSQETRGRGGYYNSCRCL